MLSHGRESDRTHSAVQVCLGDSKREPISDCFYYHPGNGRTDYMREGPTDAQRPMFQRLARLPHDLREVFQEFLLDNGMLGSIVAFALVFGAVMVALVTVILIAGLLA